MKCPHCASPNTSVLAKTTTLDYSRFSCQHCARTFNERTGTPFNFLEVPTEIMFQVVLWRLRYELSLRDLAEMFLQRGFTFTHETVRDWEVRSVLSWPSICAASGISVRDGPGMWTRPVWQ
jgi:putative transposase